MNCILFCLLVIYFIGLITVIGYSGDIGRSIYWPIYVVRFLIVELFNSFYK